MKTDTAHENWGTGWAQADGRSRGERALAAGRDRLELFSTVEVCRLKDRAQESPGSGHWHLLLERL